MHHHVNFPTSIGTEEKQFFHQSARVKLLKKRLMAVGECEFRRWEGERNEMCLVIKTHSIFFAAGNFIIKFVNVWNASYFLSMFIPPPRVARREFCFDIYTLARIKWWNYAANVSHIFSFVIRLSVFEIREEYFSYSRKAIKMFPLAHAFVIIWWKFTASADVSTGKWMRYWQRLGGRASKVNSSANVNMQLHWINGAICAALCCRSMLERDLS